MPTTSQPQTDAVPLRRYWAGRTQADGAWRTDFKGGRSLQPPGEHLAALRSGLGHPAGTVPALWPFYTSPTDGQMTEELEAEHAALSLFGLHQQSQRRSMHKRGVSVGTALRALHHSDRFSAEAVDRRVAAVVNTTSVPALVYRLRGLIPQLRSIGQPLDYDLLLQDIKDWHHRDSRRRVRRAWGLAYHSWGAQPDKQSSTDAS